MAIEGLETKGQLRRFIQEQLEGLATSQVDGLSSALASRYAEQFDAESPGALTEVFTTLLGAEFTASENMTCLVIGHFDLEGSSVGVIRLNGEPASPEAIHLETGRYSVSCSVPLELAVGDIVSLAAREAGGAAATSDHTYLTILRLT